MTVIAKTTHDQNLADTIWPQFTSTLEEKHGQKGSIGKSGEEAAIIHLSNEKFFPGIKYIISHEDCLHQLLGIDITTIHRNNTSTFIDVKTGKSNLYWERDEGWFITLKPSFFNTTKRYDAIMHMGPKKDVFAYYNVNDMREFLSRRLSSALAQDTVLMRRHWPDFIITNL